MGMMTEYYHYFFTTLVSISGGNVFHTIKKSLVFFVFNFILFLNLKQCISFAKHRIRFDVWLF